MEPRPMPETGMRFNAVIQALRSKPERIQGPLSAATVLTTLQQKVETDMGIIEKGLAIDPVAQARLRRGRLLEYLLIDSQNNITHAGIIGYLYKKYKDPAAPMYSNEILDADRAKLRVFYESAGWLMDRLGTDLPAHIRENLMRTLIAVWPDIEKIIDGTGVESFADADYAIKKIETDLMAIVESPELGTDLKVAYEEFTRLEKKFGGRG